MTLLHSINEKKAVFVDRDGTMIIDVGYPKDPAKVELLPDLIKALKKLQKMNFMIIIVSNQSGIGRGLITAEEAKDVHIRFVDLLKKQDVVLDGTYYCPHAPNVECDCRKPSPGMIIDAAKKFSINLNISFMIGDREVDIETGSKAGCKTILMGKSQKEMHQSFKADYIASDWIDAVRFIAESSF